jgi:hypothetical protein
MWEFFTTQHDNCRLTAKAHYLAAARFRVFDMGMEYSSAVLMAASSVVGAVRQQRGMSTWMPLAVGVGACLTFVYTCQGLTHNPRTMATAHYCAGTRYSELQKRYELLRRTRVWDDAVSTTDLFNIASDTLTDKHNIDKDMQTWECDYQEAKQRIHKERTGTSLT